MQKKRVSKETKVTIKIPRPLYDSLKGILEGTGFNSVTDFVVYVLRDLASSGRARVDSELSHDEVEQVRKRLKSLGYL
jgi:hypothetical protein